MVLYCLTCTFSLKVLIFLFCRILTCLIEDENHYIYLDTLFEEFNTSSGNDIEPVFTKRAFSSRLRLVFPQIRSTSSTCDNKNVTLIHGINWQRNHLDELHNHSQLHKLNEYESLFITNHVKDDNQVSYHIKHGSDSLEISLFGTVLDNAVIGLSNQSSLKTVEKTLQQITLCRGVESNQSDNTHVWTNVKLDKKYVCLIAATCHRIICSSRKNTTICRACVQHAY